MRPKHTGLQCYNGP